MKPELLEQIRAWFERYAATFAAPGGTLPPMQQLKLDHSRAVADLSRLIAGRLDWSPSRVRLAESAGLLHDTGRFTQYAEFKTFVDRNSVNHALRSWEILERDNVLAACPAAEVQMLQDAIRLHNCREIPAGLSADSFDLLRLVRDADKLDIIAIFDEAIRQGKLTLYPEISLHVDLNGPPSPEILAAVKTRQAVGYSQIKSLTDFLLIQLLWMYQLEYAPTRQLVLERNLIGTIAELLPDTPEIRDLVQAATAFVGKIN